MAKRSKLGSFLDKKGYNISKLAQVTGVNRNTIGKIYTDSSYIPSGKTIKKIMKALRMLDPNLKPDDFFDI
ncbi:helix-turn-helix domain-containing protein [Priestia megaterium]|uniref:helix-turn-helix domain-containing protein n=1 Tax=Priestia megaterium TaxID=1404 RepID=UPI001CDC02A3|nr:helix-turn-helix transcriptional regulator [Priestia megaterium]MCA4157731.1 helix-turn-helix transcriptional regulator [Priestia megaterium]